jgi:carboxyl-terminal processing protease
MRFTRSLICLPLLCLTLLPAAASAQAKDAFKTPYREDIGEDEKAAGLSRFWSEARYNFANFDLVPGLDWDALYLEYLPKVRATKSTLEYYRVLAELCARLKDGHTNVVPPAELSDELYAFPDIVTSLVEDKVLVVRVLDEGLRREGVKVGVEVVEIDGLPVKRYAAERVMPYVSASTRQDLDYRAYEVSLLDGPADAPVEILFRDDAGQTFKKTLPRLTLAEHAAKTRQAAGKAPEKSAPRFARFEVLPGNVGHLSLLSFGDRKVVAEFEAVYADILKTDALLVDVRANGGGDDGNAFQILAHFTDKPFKTAPWKTRAYNPTFRAWGRPEGWYAEPGGEQKPAGGRHYLKPVALLTGPKTFSAAEDFSVAFDYMKRGRIVGEPTGGSTGQPLYFDLPGGGRARVCTKRDTYPDGREFVGVGVRPHVPAHLSAADLRAGRDTVLEVAVAELKRALGR